MNLLFWCALLLGIFCIIYYIVILFYAGAGVNFSWIWSLGGFGCILGAMLLRYFININFQFPNWLLCLIYILIGVAVMAFLTLEAVLLFHSHCTAGKGMDYLLVLGSQINANKITRNLKKRLDTAITYLPDNPNTMVIVSGGRGRGNVTSEAAVMKSYLLEQGITEDRIRTENQSVNTTENMKFSRKLMRENATVAIVTNGFHIYRSVRLAKKQGINQVFALVAPTDKVMCLHYYVREAASIFKHGLLGNF